MSIERRIAAYRLRVELGNIPKPAVCRKCGRSGRLRWHGSYRRSIIMLAEAYVVRVPTSPDCPSMNLAASVAVLAYEWTRAPRGRAVAPAGARLELKERLWGAVEPLAAGLGWPEGERTRRLKAAVYRAGWSDAEVGMLLELARRAATARPR